MNRKITRVSVYTLLVLSALYCVYWSYQRSSWERTEIVRGEIVTGTPVRISTPKNSDNKHNEKHPLALSHHKKLETSGSTDEGAFTKPVTTKISKTFTKTKPSIKTIATKKLENMLSDEVKCSSWKKANELAFAKHPRIQLDPNKFLYPGLKWGPNNEVIGFIQSVYMAIRLNRSLVIPNFAAHSTHSNVFVPANQRIDVDRLCSLVTCVSVDTMRQSCGAIFDVALQASIAVEAHLKAYESQTKMRILLTPDEESKLNFGRGMRIRLVSGRSIPTIPALPSKEYSIRYLFPWIPMDQEYILQALGTPARCAVYTSVFASLNFTMINFSAFPLPESFVNVSKIPDNVLFSAVWNSIRRPRGIVEAAKAYVNRFLTNNFIAIHWRYDKEWRNTLCMNKATGFPIIIPRTCAALENASASTVAHRVAKEVESLDSPVVFYIATPPNLNVFKTELYDEFKKIMPNMSRPEKEMQDFINAEYEVCWKKVEWTSVGELYSLVEMEIMRLSSIFFYSGASTWSQIIVPGHVQKESDGKYSAKPSFDVNEVPLELW